jgi:hypothetical protein
MSLLQHGAGGGNAPAPSVDLKTMRQFEVEMETQLAALERHIYEEETDYIEATSASGNIIHGWEGFQDRCLPSCRRRARVHERFQFSLITASCAAPHTSHAAGHGAVHLQLQMRLDHPCFAPEVARPRTTKGAVGECSRLALVLWRSTASPSDPALK